MNEYYNTCILREYPALAFLGHSSESELNVNNMDSAQADNMLRFNGCTVQGHRAVVHGGVDQSAMQFSEFDRWFIQSIYQTRLKIVSFIV